MQLDREGTFRAVPMERGLKYTVNKALECTTRFVVVQEWDGKDSWYAVDDQPEIIGRTIIIKTDNTPNNSGIDQLKKALGWDGVNFRWLQDEDLSQTYVQIVVKAEEYQGQKRYKVAWLNSSDATPSGVLRADDDMLRKLASEHGPKLRAISGGAQIKTPLPAKPATAAKSAAAKPPADQVMVNTYGEFCRLYANKSTDEINHEWFRIINMVHPGAERKPQELMTAAEWRAVIETAKHECADRIFDPASDPKRTAPAPLVEPTATETDNDDPRF